MSEGGPEEVARSIADSNLYLTLGTADGAGRPWAAPVYYAHSGYTEFFWVSAPDTTHSRNIAARPRIGIVVFDSGAPIGTGQALYMAAAAGEVAEDGLAAGIEVFSRRSQAHGGRAWTQADVEGPSRLRLYRAVATEHHILGPEDRRIPVKPGEEGELAQRP